MQSMQKQGVQSMRIYHVTHVSRQDKTRDYTQLIRCITSSRRCHVTSTTCAAPKPCFLEVEFRLRGAQNKTAYTSDVSCSR